MLKLVAPISMNADAQTVWLQAAVDALEGITASEVNAVSALIRRSVTRPSQIVPEIAEAVAQRRSRTTSRKAESPYLKGIKIGEKAQKMRAEAKTQDEIEAGYHWERDERHKAGLYVAPLPKPLTCSEIAKLSPALVKMGLKCGALVRKPDGSLANGVHP